MGATGEEGIKERFMIVIEKLVLCYFLTQHTHRGAKRRSAVGGRNPHP